MSPTPFWCRWFVLPEKILAVHELWISGHLILLTPVISRFKLFLSCKALYCLPAWYTVQTFHVEIRIATRRFFAASDYQRYAGHVGWFKTDMLTVLGSCNGVISLCPLQSIMEAIPSIWISPGSIPMCFNSAMKVAHPYLEGVPLFATWRAACWILLAGSPGIHTY